MTLYEQAKRKARYGHNDWIVWTDRAGVQHAQKATADAIKTAMLAIGTNGLCSLIGGSTGTSYVLTWKLANNARLWALRNGSSTRK